MKCFCYVVILLLSACSHSDVPILPVVPKLAVCHTDALPDQAAPTNWKKIRVDESVVGTGDYLLGISGERIYAGGTQPEIRLQDKRAKLESIWADRVDWSVYQYTASNKSAGMSVYFDGDAKGDQHICRIENEELSNVIYSDNEDEIEPESVDLKLVGVEQLRYDMNGLLLAVESKYWNEEGKRWEARPANCYQHTTAGNLASVAFVESGSCSVLAPKDIQTRYVYGADNHLLRIISKEIRSEMGKEQYEQVEYPMIDVYDTAGKLSAEYRVDVSGTPFRKLRAPATASSNIRDTWVMEDPPRDFIFTDNWNRNWVIVSVPADQKIDYYSMELPGLNTLAKGKTNKQGLVKIKKSADAIRQALYQLDTVVAFYSEGQVFVLTPAVGAELWNSCLNPENTTREACP